MMRDIKKIKKVPIDQVGDQIFWNPAHLNYVFGKSMGSL